MSDQPPEQQAEQTPPPPSKTFSAAEFYDILVERGQIPPHPAGNPFK